VKTSHLIVVCCLILVLGLATVYSAPISKTATNILTSYKSKKGLTDTQIANEYATKLTAQEFDSITLPMLNRAKRHCMGKNDFTVCNSLITAMNNSMNSNKIP